MYFIDAPSIGKSNDGRRDRHPELRILKCLRVSESSLCRFQTAIGEFRGEAIAKILRFEDLTNFDFAVAERSALQPLDRLRLRVHLPNPITCDQFPGLGKGTVDDAALVPGEPDTGTLRTRLQSVASKHDSGFDKFLVKFPHLTEKFLGRKNSRLRILVGFNNHHESHCSFSFSYVFTLPVNRTNESRIDNRRCRLITDPVHVPLL